MKSTRHALSLSIVCSFLLLSACETTPPPPPGTSGNAQRGHQLAQTGCTSCHAFEGRGPVEVAPTWGAIAKAWDGNRTALEQFLRNPDPDAARVHGAVERFGPMPNMGLTAQQTRDLAAFIAEATFDPVNGALTERGRWEKAPADPPTSPLDHALAVARSTKGTLGKQLMTALAKGGPEFAVPFCNERAIPLTDSASRALNARIRRVSDRPRNPANRAEGRALQYLQAGHAALKSGETVAPTGFQVDDIYTAFVPILTNEMCLQCHGTSGIDMLYATQERIRDSYPEDQAIGYAANELRGMWVVEFSTNDTTLLTHQ